MKLIGLENLPNSFKVYLDDKFRRHLFRKALKKLVTKGNLEKALGYKSDNCSLIRGYRQDKNKRSLKFLKVGTLKKLSKITGVTTQEIEKNIVGIKSKGVILKIKFPIFANKELASLVGHCFGDGHVSNQKCYYYNTSLELVKNYQNNLKIVFNIKPKMTVEKEGQEFYRLSTPTNVGRLLILTGAPSGRKTIQKLKIPNWVINGTKEIKASFIRALYDDEGCISFRKGGKNSIIFSLATRLNTQYLRMFLNSIRRILLDLKIESNEINKEKLLYRPGRKSSSIILQFTITGYENFKIFSQELNPVHPLKKQKLQEVLKNYKEFHYRRGKCEKIILKGLEQRPRTIKDLANELNRTDEPIRLSLHKLKNKGLVVKTGLHPTVWKLNIRSETNGKK